MNFIKKIIPSKYKRNIKEKLGVPGLHWSLLNLKKNNFEPKVVIDIGAYVGNWTLELLEVFPSAKVLMVEAQEQKEQALKNIVSKNNKIDYSISLLSSKSGEEKMFEQNETGSQVVTDDRISTSLIKLSTQTLDDLLLQKKFPFPDFLKLDVQGHELEVLKGAEQSLKHAEVCLLELSLLDFGANIPLLPEVINFMDERKYQAYDISQFMRRPYDKALFQIDMFFVKNDSPLVQSKRWD